MNWISLLASLRLQTSTLTFKLFETLKINEHLFLYPEKLIFSVEEGPLKSFLREKPYWFEESYKTFDWLAKNNAFFTYFSDPTYPQEFYRLSEPPLFLTYFGSPCWLTHEKLSVVGSRYPSPKSFSWMEEHLSNIISKNIVTVSGAARGIDQKAHSLSLRQKKPTVAFIPSGLSMIYPAIFEEWVSEIRQTGGAVVSEYSPHQSMMKHHFLQRNRMIAVMGKCLLVIEARRPSGTLMTSRLAIDEGQTVCVVPSFPDDLGFKGSVDLLFQGAFPIRDATDVKVLLGLHAISTQDQTNQILLRE